MILEYSKIVTRTLFSTKIDFYYTIIYQIKNVDKHINMHLLLL